LISSLGLIQGTIGKTELWGDNSVRSCNKLGARSCWATWWADVIVGLAGGLQEKEMGDGRKKPAETPVATEHVTLKRK